MDTKPTVVIVSSSNTKPKSIIKLITKETPSEDPTNQTQIIHPWNLETKYYTAEINLIGITDAEQSNKEFNDNVEALIIHMDSNKDSGLDDLKKWDFICTNCDPDIKLLLSNYCNNETKVTKGQARNWCQKRGFEFIELYPAKQNIQQEDEQDIIPDKVGVERIIEALETRVWSNLIMKDIHSSSARKQVENGENATSDDFLTDEGSDEFTDLFNQLNMMKDTIQSLPTRERKLCAEQMATAFWKAIGGDEEEIADI